MPRVVTITGSPNAGSRTAAVTEQVAAALTAQGFSVDAIDVRELPPADLMAARSEAPAVQQALRLVDQADGVVVATPVYKAAYSGLLKTFIDLLPQFGLAGKVVLPLATGGSLAHVLAIDYALRPVLVSLGAGTVVGGVFVLDRFIERAGTTVVVDPEIRARLDTVVADFASCLRRHGPPPA
ncbi:MAG TPA: NADPH-dependent FMN reductase [Polyangia bacterium]|nr:NADPH-dependent FMN reductase [Polyangia bacterium]